MSSILLSPFLFSYPLFSFFSIPLFFQTRCSFPINTAFYSVESCQSFNMHFIKQKRRDCWLHDYILYLFSENYPLLVQLLYIQNSTAITMQLISPQTLEHELKLHSFWVKFLGPFKDYVNSDILHGSSVRFRFPLPLPLIIAPKSPK